MNRTYEQLSDSYEIVRQLYSAPDFIGTLQYIEKHPELKVLLLKALEEIKNIFGRNAGIELHVYSDPTGESPEKLLLAIQTNTDTKAALTNLDKFDVSWWLKIDFKIRRLVSIDVSCV